MKFVKLECGYCDASYALEFDPDDKYTINPEYCPFCGEALEEDPSEYESDDYDSDDGK